MRRRGPHFPWCLASAVLALVVPALSADVFQIPFTTDLLVDPTRTAFNNYSLSTNDTGLFGPDGPWQAAVVISGYRQRPALTELWVDGRPLVPMWPTGSVITQFLTTAGGGVYKQSTNATKPWAEWGNNGDNDLTLADINAMQRSEGQGILDYITLANARFEPPGYANINATIYAMNSSRILNRDNKTTYKPEIGNLALGRPGDINLGGIQWPGTSLIEQMKTQGLVKSNSFGLHLGSAPLGQKGSLILGGYDEARVVGPVAAFEMQLGDPLVFLANVFLSSEPNSPSHYLSPPQPVWQGDASDAVGEHFGAKKGYIVIFPNPAVPGIYLPGPTCANAAKYLPVHYDNTTGYYLWDTTHPSYLPLVSSPSYLAFTFSDYLARNTTIKIPLALLNLTLTSPIVNTPTPYFPCHDVNKNNDYWELGRAFLQGAFFGVNFDQNLTFLAQAPGPDMAQSVIRPLKPEDRTLVVTQPDSAFVDSWGGVWTAMGEVIEKKGLSGGAMVGVIIGAIAGLGAVGGALWMLWRRRVREKADEADPAELNTGGLNRHKPECDSKAGVDIKEADTETRVNEAADTPVLEMDSPQAERKVVSEAPSSPGVYEMGNPDLEFVMASEALASPQVYEMPGSNPGSREERPH